MNSGDDTLNVTQCNSKRTLYDNSNVNEQVK